MTDAEVEAKYRKLAIHHLRADEVDALAAAVWNLDRVADVAELLRLTVPRHGA